MCEVEWKCTFQLEIHIQPIMEQWTELGYAKMGKIPIGLLQVVKHTQDIQAYNAQNAVWWLSLAQTHWVSLERSPVLKLVFSAMMYKAVCR